MGLDMYLHASKTLNTAEADAVKALIEGMRFDSWIEGESEVYLSGWNHSEPSEKLRTSQVLNACKMLPLMSQESPSATVVVKDGGEVVVQTTAVYWRKANSIHAWFVNNCQDGVDECQESDPINFEQLAQLVSVCNTAVSHFDAGRWDEAVKALPPTGGFFFGSTDADEWWRESLSKTAIEIQKAVENAIRIGDVNLTYHSSW